MAKKKNRNMWGTLPENRLPGGAKRATELFERCIELQSELEVARDTKTKKLLKAELVSAENLLEPYWPYLKGRYPVIEKKAKRGKKKSRNKSWVHIWQGGAPQ